MAYPNNEAAKLNRDKGDGPLPLLVEALYTEL